MIDKLQSLFPKHYRSGNTLLINADCMEVMKHIEDGEVQLAIVDPPFGIGAANMQMGKGVGTDSREWVCKDWDDAIPSADYFSELERVSENRIIWGGNYMTDHLRPSSCWIIWDKMQEFSGATFEMAWTSCASPAKAFRMSRAQAYCNQLKIHPTQKPVKLYQWLLDNYAKPDQRILDTHGGSFSSAIAAHYFGCEYIGVELDSDYFKAGVERFEQMTRQVALF